MGEPKLTKAEIIERIHQEVDVSKKNIHKILDLLFQEIKAGLLQDQIIELRGFGTFEVKTRKGRKARNPKTGEVVDVSNHGVAVFRPGRELKQKAWFLRE
ncbi:MAG TPA: integration host factor subunit beta [bacterium]|nr:integration host factor subunit beta [bacterium]